MENNFKLIVDSFGKERFMSGAEIKNYTNLGITGRVKLLFIAFSESELIKVINMCAELKVPFFLIGTGSKVMLKADGFDGILIKNRTRRISTLSLKGKVKRGGIDVSEALIEVESGVSVESFCKYLMERKLIYEQFEHIPGSIGGNLFINAILQRSCKSIKVLIPQWGVSEISVEHLSLKKHIILSAVFGIKAVKT